MAASLQTKLDATPVSTRAHLRTRDKTVTFTRNWARVMVNGKTVVLDAPVRVKQGCGLVPESFVGRVVPTLVAGAPAGAATSRMAVRGGRGHPGGRAGALVSLVHPDRRRDVGGRSPPHRVERTQGSARPAARSRAGAQVEGIHDGLIAEVRLERAGADGLLRVVFEGRPGRFGRRRWPIRRAWCSTSPGPPSPRPARAGSRSGRSR